MENLYFRKSFKRTRKKQNPAFVNELVYEGQTFISKGIGKMVYP